MLVKPLNHLGHFDPPLAGNAALAGEIECEGLHSHLDGVVVVVVDTMGEEASDIGCEANGTDEELSKGGVKDTEVTGDRCSGNSKGWSYGRWVTSI